MASQTTLKGCCISNVAYNFSNANLKDEETFLGVLDSYLTGGMNMIFTNNDEDALLVERLTKANTDEETPLFGVSDLGEGNLVWSCSYNPFTERKKNAYFKKLRLIEEREGRTVGEFRLGDKLLNASLSPTSYKFMGYVERPMYVDPTTRARTVRGIYLGDDKKITHRNDPYGYDPSQWIRDVRDLEVDQ